MKAAGEKPEFDIEPRFGVQFFYSYLMMSFPQGYTSASQRGFEVRVFPLLGELQRAIVPHLPVFRLYRWQLSPNKWSSPMIKSLYPIVVTTFRWASHGKASDPPQVELPSIVWYQRHGQWRHKGIL